MEKCSKRKTAEPSSEEDTETKGEMEQPTTKKGRSEEERSHKEAQDSAGGDDPNQKWLLDVLEDEHLKSLAKQAIGDKHATLKEYEAAFARIADRLLNEVALMVNGKPHRLAEIEYYYEGGNHHDTFTHCDTLQQTSGNWYFHKSGTSYKGGSYKGLDITFGGQVGADGKRAFGGILIRAIEPVTGKAPSVIEGPSLVVDHILSTCKADSIINLVKADFAGSEDSPPAHYTNDRKLYLAPITAVPSSPSVHYETVDMSSLEVRVSPRVGLTLKKVRADAETFIMKAYRYFIYPELMKKGKVYMICALHFVGGQDVASIQKISKTGKATIENYVRDFESGRSKSGDVSSFRNLNLNTADLCGLYGAVSCLL